MSKFKKLAVFLLTFIMVLSIIPMTSMAANDGWFTIDGVWYYLYPKHDGGCGKMLKGWQQIDSKWYYLDEDGYAVCEEYIKGYWLNKNGVWANTAIASWKKNKNGWWYGDTTGWYAKDQGLRIDGKWYYFGEDGYLIEE